MRGVLQRRKRTKHGLKPGHEREWPKHLRFVRGFKCLACEKEPPPEEYLIANIVRPHPIEAAHVRTGTGGGMGLKPPDWWTIPLCPAHHDEQHKIGERAFEEKYGFDMKEQAHKLADRSPDKDMRQTMLSAAQPAHLDDA
jgi:hypothetical protein